MRDIRKIRGNDVRIWLGGPEATYYPERFLREDGADLCMLGEGEETFTSLLSSVSEGKHFPGLAFLQEGQLVSTGPALPVDMDRIPFLYRDLSLFANRIIYYESSRGCPFACAYCLSGREKGIRYRNWETVRQELQFFLDQRVSQVKMIDRTFNASEEFAMKVWTYLKEHDNGVTNFHFEIEADRLTGQEIALLQTLRPGLVQMEIGVQSANEDTLRAVHRRPDLTHVSQVMEALVPAQNINLHLDLIAGLPFEDLKSFRRSFNTVYAMRPHQFQLGFLKLLKGTELYDRREEYGLVCSEDAPYEVLKTKWLSYEEIALLQRISDRVEEFVNSQGFRRSLPLVESLFPDAFTLFENLADFYARNGYETRQPSVQKRYELFTDFAGEASGRSQGRTEEGAYTPYASRQEHRGASDRIRETIRFDRALHVHASRRMTAEETFDFGEGPVKIRFDYRVCSPVNGEAKWTIIA